MEKQEAAICLRRKLQILEKIAASTATQQRFVERRDMRGLKRVLREREALIGELAAVTAVLTADQSWQSDAELRPLREAARSREQAVLGQSRQVLQAALAERARIAAELRGSRAERQLQSQYLHPWAIAARGGRINERG